MSDKVPQFKTAEYSAKAGEPCKACGLGRLEATGPFRRSTMLAVGRTQPFVLTAAKRIVYGPLPPGAEAECVAPNAISTPPQAPVSAANAAPACSFAVRIAGRTTSPAHASAKRAARR